jgi:8-oxo-dGTP pyrophosphatase MutT (NUDIX family)
MADFERLEVHETGLRRAAVAIALAPDPEGEACFLLTKRAPRLRAHGGQWALPGGRLDEGESVTDAVLRELREEVGLELAVSAVLGILDDYPTRSGYCITPVVLWCGAEVELEANPAEVAEVYHVRLAELERSDVPRVRSIPESDRPVLSFPLLGTHIHAPTAAVLYQMREAALHGRATRVAHYDQPVFAWR